MFKKTEKTELEIKTVLSVFMATSIRMLSSLELTLSMIVLRITNINEEIRKIYSKNTTADDYRGLEMSRRCSGS